MFAEKVSKEMLFLFLLLGIITYIRILCLYLLIYLHLLLPDLTSPVRMDRPEVLYYASAPSSSHL